MNVKRLHFLTEGFVTTNTRASFFPLIVHRRALKKRMIEWRAFTSPEPAAFDCDVLVVESNFHGKRWLDDSEGVLGELDVFRQRSPRLFYFDHSDSSALLHPEVLPYVDRYLKNQLLADRALYRDVHYGRRVFTDFVHHTHGVNDSAPEDSVPVQDTDGLDKLTVAWNSSIADWSPSGRYRMEAYARLPLALFLALPGAGTNPACDRPNDVSCRMGTNYARATVAWNRKAAMEKLARWTKADRVSYREYIRELRSSKIVVSPFGWGEINYKDYETFLAGAALVKPDMSHLETWPDLYRANETYVAYDWDTENLADAIEHCLQDPEATASVARQGQQNYMAYLSGSSAADHFCDRVQAVLSDATP